MEQYIPDTPAYVSWNPLLLILWSEWNSTYDPNLHMQWCQVCSVPFWSQYHKKRIPTYIYRGVRYVLFHSDYSITSRGFLLCLWYCNQNGTVHTWHPCISKLESSSCGTVIRMEQYIPDTPAYVI
jgi:hypothetical protein